MQLGTNDMLSEQPSIIVSDLHINFSFQKPSKSCLLMKGAWSPCGETVLKASGLHWIAGLRAWNSLVMNP